MPKSSPIRRPKGTREWWHCRPSIKILFFSHGGRKVAAGDPLRSAPMDRVSEHWSVFSYLGFDYSVLEWSCRLTWRLLVSMLNRYLCIFIYFCSWIVGIGLVSDICYVEWWIFEIYKRVCKIFNWYWISFRYLQCWSDRSSKFVKNVKFSTRYWISFRFLQCWRDRS